MGTNKAKELSTAKRCGDYFDKQQVDRVFCSVTFSKRQNLSDNLISLLTVAADLHEIFIHQIQIT